MAEPGETIIVDAGSNPTKAIISESMQAHALQRWVAGMVMNGATRDAAALRAGTLPVLAAGVTHRGPYKDSPGKINAPVAFDGMVVMPGDLLIGDGDGIFSVPFDQVGAVHAALTK